MFYLNKGFSLVQHLFLLCTFLLFTIEATAQVNNDNCGTAIIVTVPMNNCGATVSGTTVSASWSGVGSQSSSCADYNANKDIWYSFVAPLSGILSLSYTTDGSLRYDLFQGNCSNLTYKTCSSISNGSSTKYLTGLVPGATYFLRFFEADNKDRSFSFCMKGLSIPSNNDCMNSESVTVSSSGCSNSIEVCGYTASASGFTTPSCYPYTNSTKDVWFDFVAPANGKLIVETTLSSNARGFTIYGGTTCTSLIEAYCAHSLSEGRVENLTAGDTYKIRFWTNGTLPTFTFCLREVSAPANDLCSTAIAITIGTSTCGATVTGEDIDASDSGEIIPACGDGTDDLWYSFTAPTSGNLEITSTLTNGKLAIYTGSCGALSTIYCGDFSNTLNIDGLSGGANYLMQIWNEADDFGSFSFCMMDGPPAPINDDCTAAINTVIGIDVDGPPYTGSNVSATDSGVSSPSCSSQDAGDIWYQFTAGATGHVKVELMATDWQQTTVVLYTGSCGALVEETCHSFGNAPGFVQFTGLTVSGNYFLRWFDENNDDKGDIQFSLRETQLPPVNDQCSSPINVLVGSGSCGASAFGNTENGNYDSYGNSSCNSTEYSNLWYEFVAPGSGTLNLDILATSSSIYYYISVYSGACGSLTEVFCEPMYHSDILFISGINAGDSYLLAIKPSTSSDIDFEFCLEEGLLPPANDLCAAAISVTVGSGSCGATEIGNSSGASDSGVPYNLCTIYEQKDIWYSFVAPLTGAIEVDIISESWSGIRLQLFSGTCGSLTELECTSMHSSTNALFNALISGDTYFLRWTETNFSTNGEIQFCLQEAVAGPVNNFCTGAISTVVGVGACGAAQLVDNTLAGNSGGATPDCGSFQGGDLWYSFIAPATGTVIIDVLAESWSQPYFSLYSDSCGTLTEITCLQNTDEQTVGSLITGDTYYIRWWDFDNNNFGTLEFCLQEGLPAPANDLCANAIAVNVGTGGNCGDPMVGTLNLANSSGEVIPTCYSSFNHKDLWYSFVAPSTGEMELDIITEDWSTVYAALYSGSCGSLVEVFCDRTYASSNANITNLIAGDNYLLRFWDNSNSSNGMSFCLQEKTSTSGNPPPANDLCSTAILVDVGVDTCGAEVTGSIWYSTDSGEPSPSCGNYSGGDIWYQFVAPSSGDIDIDLSSTSIPNSHIALYSGTCGALTEFDCEVFTLGYIGNYSGLTPGDIYFIRIWPSDTGIYGTTRFCIREIPSAPANDDCATPIVLTDSNDNSCNNLVSASTSGATMGAEENCQGSFAKEVYFSFIAPKDKNYTIEISNETAPLFLDLAEGSCGALSTMACTSNGSLTYPLVSNVTYTLRVYAQTFSQPIDFDICVYLTSSVGAGVAEAVGIGIEDPVERLQVNGGIMIANTDENFPGTLRFKAGQFQGHNGSDWVALSASGGVGSNGAKVGDDLGSHLASQNLNMNSKYIINVQTPTTGKQGANKLYVDDEHAKRWKINSSNNLYFSGFVGIGNETPAFPLHVGSGAGNGNGAHVTLGGTWTNGSSRLFKENFKLVNGAEILKKLATLEIGTWDYIDTNEGSHMGPIAEDFYQAFGLGGNPQYISTVDADGVALAAIQALNEKLELQEKENQELKKMIELMSQRIDGLEKK